MSDLQYRVGILTVSDRAARGAYEDKSAPLIAGIFQNQSMWQVTHRAIVPDEIPAITAMLTEWRNEGVSLILTSGGTGFATRDVTPEATKPLIERETPGIAETLRAESLKITSHAMLSRGVAGISQSTLIINLPGSPKAVRESMQILLPVLPHALDLLLDRPDSEKGHRKIEKKL